MAILAPLSVSSPLSFNPFTFSNMMSGFKFLREGRCLAQCSLKAMRPQVYGILLRNHSNSVFFSVICRSPSGPIITLPHSMALCLSPELQFPRPEGKPGKRLPGLPAALPYPLQQLMKHPGSTKSSSVRLVWVWIPISLPINWSQVSSPIWSLTFLICKGRVLSALQKEMKEYIYRVWHRKSTHKY